MTFDYQPSGLGKANRNAHPECGVTFTVIVVILVVAGFFLFR